jgi:hypothetical protein
VYHRTVDAPPSSARRTDRSARARVATVICSRVLPRDEEALALLVGALVHREREKKMTRDSIVVVCSVSQSPAVYSMTLGCRTGPDWKTLLGICSPTVTASSICERAGKQR